MDCNCLRQVYGELNLHGKKSPKGCRKLFAATLPQSLRQTCRSSSPEDPFFGKGCYSFWDSDTCTGRFVMLRFTDVPPPDEGASVNETVPKNYSDTGPFYNVAIFNP